MIPYAYYYDVVTWSYPLQRGLAGSGFLTQPMSAGGPDDRGPRRPTTGPRRRLAVYAFNTDSIRGLGLATDLLDKGVNVYRAKSRSRRAESGSTPVRPSSTGHRWPPQGLGMPR